MQVLVLAEMIGANYLGAFAGATLQSALAERRTFAFYAALRR